jgi:hypothetical protein
LAERPHDRILRDIGREILGPIGVVQKGRSRTWLDDQLWFVTVIEFQPGRSPGAYLNVGVNWLWEPKSHYSFDLGSRVMELQVAHEDWPAKARLLVETAAAEVIAYRGRLPHVGAAASAMTDAGIPAGWPVFHAAIANALAGNAEEADRLFQRFLASEDPRPWAVEARDRARGLRALLTDDSGFRHQIIDDIKRSRALLCLREISLKPLPLQPPRELSRDIRRR